VKLSKEAVEELKKIHLKVYGYEIGDEEAMALGIRLLEFFALVLPHKVGGREV
jgi:hypothetical protein